MMDRRKPGTIYAERLGGTKRERDRIAKAANDHVEAEVKRLRAYFLRTGAGRGTHVQDSGRLPATALASADPNEKESAPEGRSSICMRYQGRCVSSSHRLTGTLTGDEVA